MKICKILNNSIRMNLKLSEIPSAPPAPERKTIVSIVDDDGRTSFTESGYKEYLETEGINYNLSIVKAGAESTTTSYYHVPELLEMQEQGNDILNHYINFNSVTVDDLSNLETSKQYFIDNNLIAGQTIFVYPNGEFVEDVRNLVGTVFDYALNVEDYTQQAGYANDNPPSYGRWNQVPLQKANNIVRKEVSNSHTLEEFQNTCQSAFENTGWIVIFTHSKHATFDLNIVKSVIEYCKTQDCEFMTVSQAIININ